MQLKSIQQKITLWAGLCLFLALGVFVAVSAMTTRLKALEEAEGKALDTARVEAAKVKSTIDRAFDTARALGSTFKATKDKAHPLKMTRDDANAMLRKTLEENPQFLGVYTLWEPNLFDGQDDKFVNAAGHDRTGRLIPYWVRNQRDEIILEPLVDYEKEGAGDWYLVPKRTQKETLMAPILYPIAGRPTLMSSQLIPLMIDGKFQGVAGVDLKLDFIQTLVDRVNVYGGAGSMILMNGQGDIIGMSRRPELMAKPIRETDPEFEKYLLMLKTGRDIVKFSGDSLKVMVPITMGQTDAPWAACLVVPLKEIMAPVNALIWRQSLIGLGLIVIALALLWYLAGQLAAPVKVAAQFAARLAQGESVAKLPVKTDDETGQLLLAMNSMLDGANTLVQTREERDSLQRSIIKLLDQVSSVAEGDLTHRAEVASDATGAIADSFNFMIGELRRIVGDVKQVADEVTTSASNTQQTTQHLAEEAKTRAEQIIRASQEIDAMADSIRRVSETADTSKEVAHQSLATAKRGAAVLQNTVAGMNRLREQVQETAKRIKRLGEHSQEIGESVQLINDIAYRTSVLALNASIQAARAGEAGRGFAVVAEDVERLAKRSSEATKRIAELVKTTQAGAKEAITAMEESTRGVVEGTNLMHEAGAALTEIEAVSTRLAELVQGISVTAEHQRQESAEVSQRMVQLSAATENTAYGIRQSALEVNHLAALADELNVSVASFKLGDALPSRFNTHVSGSLQFAGD